MPTIWNINSTYAINNKKVATKLTFETGEKFSARVIDMNGDKKEVVLRLLDGWQFPAELENTKDISKNSVLRFQVEGYENGKLIIKQIKTEGNQEEQTESSLQSILEENGFDKSDVDILKSMIKYNMPLTKENISKVKSILDFKEKIGKDAEEEENFIKNYISSKNVSQDSKEGKSIRDTLREFFKEFKNLSKEDVLLFLENNIDFNKDNIDSFQKIFKDSLGLYKEIEEIKGIAEEDNRDVISIDVQKNLDSEIPIKDIETELESVKVEEEGESLEDSLKNILQDIFKNNVEIDKDAVEHLKDILDIFNKDNLVNNIKDKLGEEDIDLIIKDILVGDVNEEDLDNIRSIVTVSKESVDNLNDQIKSAVKNLFAQDFILSENEINKTVDTIKTQFVEKNMMSFMKGIAELSDKISMSLGIMSGNMEINVLGGTVNEGETSNNVLNLLKNFSQDKDIVKLLVQDILYDKKFDMSQSDLEHLNRQLRNLTDNDILNEIKNVFQNSDNDGAFVKDLNFSTKDVENIFNNILKSDIKFTEEDSGKIINSLKEFLGAEEISGNISKDTIVNAIKSKTEETLLKESKINISNGAKDTSEIIKEQISSKNDFIKGIIKDIIDNKPGFKSEAYHNALDFIKSNINDFKLFNTLSNQYYYLDIPVTLNNNEYPCKLMIKDEREKGKIIDSKNAKLVISVKTNHIGMVDGYIKVKDFRMSIDIKCEEKWVKVLDMAKGNLINSLENIGYEVKVNVERRIKESNIANCREFFNDSDLSALDVKV